MTRESTRIPILTYHSLDTSGSVVSVTPDLFPTQMSRLAEIGWCGISLLEAIEHKTAHGTWPGGSVVLTFDDAFANVVEHAVPVLKRLGFKATVFVVTGYVGRR